MICSVALALKDLLESCGLKPFVMTTGSHGLHVRVPIKREYMFTKVRAFARDIAQIVVEQNPERITLESRKQSAKAKF